MQLKEQLKRQSLAVISLAVALTALGYNTWRNESTEDNRNLREAGFEMLVHIGELQRISYLAHYDKDVVTGSPRAGWVEVLILNDLAELMPESIKHQATQLQTVWGEHWDDLGEQDEAVQAIEAAIDGLRGDVVRNLESLD